jgi:(S)-2-hydroxyglutarate dehydrogenase
MCGNQRTNRIVPFRGEYYQLSKRAERLVNHLIYPVPDPKFPFLGVHFTRKMDGTIECGPNAVLALSREGYSWSQISAKDCADFAMFGGFWKFLLRHKKMCFDELHSSFSKTYFCSLLKRFVPDITESDLVSGGSGVRAQAMSPNGSLVQDFDLVKSQNALHVLNAPSPGATASFSIADHVLAESGLVSSII